MLELFGTARCEYTAQLREDLEWRRVQFVEYDVETSDDAMNRMLSLTGGDRTVPVLVRDGVVEQTGWQGRGCYAGT